MSRARRRRSDKNGRREPAPTSAPENRPRSALPAPPGFHPVLLAVAVVVAVAFSACVVGITNAFAQDDLLILQDARLHDLTRWRSLFTQAYWPPPYPPDLYRPLTSLLLTLQYALGSGAPLTYRIVSYVLYAGVSVAFLFAARQMLRPPIALAAAVLFAAHPVHVEVTALGVAQAEIVVALATLLAVRLYLTRRAVGSPLSAIDWVLIALLYVLAALSKEQGLLLPAFLVLCELILIPRTAFGARVRSLGAGYAMLASVALALLAIRASVLADATATIQIAEALVGKTVAGRAVTMLQVVPEWLRLLAWPEHLRLDYSPQEFVGSRSIGGKEALGIAILTAAIMVGWSARRRAPTVTFGLAWTALALVPVSNIIVPTGVLIAERTLFLPSIGFLIAVGGVIQVAAESPSMRSVPARRGAVAALVILAALGIGRSAQRQLTWRSNDALTLAAIKDSPRSWRAQANYGELMFERGDTARGRDAFERAILLAPSPWWTRNAYAKRLRMVGEDRAALDQLQRSLREFPSQIEAVPEYVATLIALGQYETARDLSVRIIASAGAPPLMVMLRNLADSSLAAQAPPGSVRVRIP